MINANGAAIKFILTSFRERILSYKSVILYYNNIIKKQPSFEEM